MMELTGIWKQGIAYDVHTLASHYLGTDDFGHLRFDNIRSEMGELVYQLKYQENLTCIDRIVDLIVSGVKGLGTFNYFVPVPASKPRAIQPVHEITKALSIRMGVAYLEALGKSSNEALKNVLDPEERKTILQKSIHLTIDSSCVQNRKILLVDDLYRSGATLEASTRVLQLQGAGSVCVLALTKTRSSR